MFSYTDDAIVTNSAAGRHLSTVIRRPAALGPIDWAQHAEAVCKVLNGKGPDLRICDSIVAGLQVVGRVKRQPVPTSDPGREENLATLAELYPGYILTAPSGRVKRESDTTDATSDPSDFGPLGRWPELKIRHRNVKGEWNDALAESLFGPGSRYCVGTGNWRHSLHIGPSADSRDALIAALEEELAAAHEKLEAPIEVTEQLAARLYHMPKGGTAPFNNRTFKRVE